MYLSKIFTLINGKIKKTNLIYYQVNILTSCVDYEYCIDLTFICELTTKNAILKG